MKIFEGNHTWMLGLFLIIITAIILRIINININPPELFSDELINFVSAKSVIEEGKDLHGKFLPFFYDRVELRPPIYGYSAYVSSKLFGDSTLAIRFPAVIYGIITIIMLYILTLEITNSHLAALFSSYCLSIIPWHIHYSRVGWEPASLLPFLLSAIVLLIKGINKDNKWLIIFGFAFFSLTIYTYQAAPLFAFLFLITIVGFNYRYFLKKKRIFIIGLTISGVIAFPYIWTVINEPHLYDRARRINTFYNGINRETMGIFIKNYFSHFSLNFLFKNGDPNLRHGAQTGVLYWWMFPAIVLGLILLNRSIQKSWYYCLILFWLIIFPLAGSLTNDGVPHATRTLIGAPLFSLICGIGTWKAIQIVHKLTKSKLLAGFALTFILIISLASLLNFSRKYFQNYPTISSGWWDYGHRQIFNKISKMDKFYERACLGNLNYWNELQLKKYYLENTQLEIINDVNDISCQKPGSVVVVKADESKNIKGDLIDKVYNLENIPIYYIYSVE